jgi:hypothetical protein
MTLFPADVKITMKITNGSVFAPTFHRGGMKAFRNAPQEGNVTNLRDNLLKTMYNITLQSKLRGTQ